MQRYYFLFAIHLTLYIINSFRAIVSLYAHNTSNEWGYSFMNLILNKSKKMRTHTDLRMVFQSIDNLQLNYNWLITNLDCNFYPNKLLGSNYYWLTGAEITELVNQHEIQFSWAVFSGFLPKLKVDLSDESAFPYADGNPNFWTAKPTIQHSQASVEIVCWDSTSTLLLSNEAGIGLKFKNYFEEAEILEEHNIKFL